MPGRSYTGNGYRYGFNGMEKDDEVKGGGNSLDFGARVYDSRLGRWNKPDLLECAYSDLSPYSFAANSPITLSDIDGERILVKGADGVIYFFNGSGLLNVEDYSPYKGNDNYVNILLSDLIRIRTGGSEGFRLITELMDRKEEIVIQAGEEFHSKGLQVVYGDKTQLPVNESTQWSPRYVSLVHELAHIEDYIHGMTRKLLGVPMYSIWVPGATEDEKSIREAEKYATFIENLIRKENKLQLRTHYALTYDETGYYKIPDERTRILNLISKEHIYINKDKYEKSKPNNVEEGSHTPSDCSDCSDTLPTADDRL